MADKETYHAEIKDRMRSFARRHYINASLMNGAVFLVSAGFLLLFVSLVEYSVKSSSEIRAVVFYALLVALISAFIYMVMIPLMRAIGMIRRMNDEALSLRIGSQVKEVDDKLLNILLLERMKDQSQSEVITAAINQKAYNLRDVPFHLSASVKRGLRFLRNSGIVIICLIALGAIFPDVFQYGTKRVVFYSQDIKPPPPFVFNVKASSRAIKNESYNIDIEVNGDVLPNDVFVNSDGKIRKARKVSQNQYKYSLKNVTKDFSFNLTAEGVESEEFKVEVLSRPMIREFDVYLDYPSYVNKEDQEFKNIGNLNVPEGTRIKWKIKVDNAEYLTTNFDSKISRRAIKEQAVILDSVFTRSSEYSFGAGNENGLLSDSINYKLSVVYDNSPRIEVYQNMDSLEVENVYVGRISDDYGLSKFRFGYIVNGEKTKYRELGLEKGLKNWEFVYEVDWSAWDVNAGDEIVYFFEVWDNDGVNGPKYSRSRNMIYRLPSQEEIIAEKEGLTDDIEKEMEEAIEEARELKEEIKDLQKDMVDEKKLDWSDKKRIEDLLRKNESLKNRLNEISEKNKKKNSFEDEMKHSEEINSKREELEKLMEKVLDDETLEKLKELEELMDKLRKEDVQEALEDIELSNEQLEQELDRSLELFRQYEFEMQLENTLEKLDELQEEQNALREETEEGKTKDESLEEKQNELNQKFEEWDEEMDKLSEMNEQLENKHDLNNNEEKREGTKDDMKNASEQLQKGKNKKAGENQKNAEQKMSEMKDDLNALQMGMKAKAAEDVQSLRNTLENLIEISFRQEEIMQDMKGMRNDDPRFNEITKEQRSILDGMKVVEDSLNALSKRIVQIEPIINRETAVSKREMEKSIKAMTERKMNNVSRHQQLAMTSTNNLALLLSEIVDQLQEQMAQSQGQCKKPGSNQPSSSSMKSMQKQLNDQLKEMKKMMEQGKKPGEKPGQQGKGDKEAESLAKMAAEQAKIREELRKMSENADQKDAKKIQKIGEMMEETERDIVNRQITQETIMRQEKILTRMLEAEDAEREQDMEERRESITGSEKEKGNLFDAKEYYRSRYGNHEELIKENISFKRYFEDKVEEYYKNLSQ